jgi:DNA polymerase phi
MRFLLVHACYDFVPGGNAAGSSMEALQLGGPAPVLAPEVRQMCATRLGGLIADSLTAATATIRTSADLSDPSAAEAAAADAVLRKQRATDCSTHLAQLTELFTKAERAHALVQLSQPLEAPAAAVRKAVCALLPALDRLAAADAAGGRSGTGTQADSARALLRVLLIMQLGAPQDYTPDMEDLPQCLRAAFPAAGFPADAAAVPEAADAEEPPHHMDVLVEVLLSLLAKPSAVLRDVVERVFRAFAADVTPEGVRSMLRVVTRSKGRRHSSAAASDSDDDSESDEDDAGDGEDEEEVEEDGEDGEDDSDGEQAQQPSRSGAQPRAAAAGSDDSDSDDGAGMDDEAMFKTDAALAAVLSLSKAEKTKKKTAAEALTHFKFRVLSLLELFIKAQPSSPLIPVRAPARARLRRHAPRLLTRVSPASEPGGATAARAHRSRAGAVRQRDARRPHFGAARQGGVQGARCGRQPRERAVARGAAVLVHQVPAPRLPQHGAQGCQGSCRSMPVSAARAGERRPGWCSSRVAASPCRRRRLLCIQEVPPAVCVHRVRAGALPGCQG